MNSSFIKKEYIIDLAVIIFGSILGSLGINMFLIHANLLSGGLSGIALIIQYKFKIEAGYLILLLNVPLFILSFLKLNKKFTIYSLIGTLTLSISLIITHPVASILNINDKLLYCLYGGVLNGVGYGLVFSHYGSTGGLDIISMLIRKKYSNFNIGKITFAINIVIVGLGAVIFGIPTALYTLIAMYIQAFVLDHVIEGLGRKKMVFIITSKEKEIEEFITTKLQRGVTYLYGEGAYTNKQKKIIYCILPLSQLPELKNKVNSIDNKAFLTIADATEVLGKGFNSPI